MTAALAGWALLWDDVALIDDRPERFAPFAFAEPMVARLVVSHDLRPGAVLARSSNGLMLEQNDTGLRFTAFLDDSADARQAMAAVRYGGLSSCSFAFRPIEVRDDDDGTTMVRARLTEISLTGSPAYPAGGVWATDAVCLPPRLEHLRELWQDALTTRPPPRDTGAGTTQASHRPPTRPAWPDSNGSGRVPGVSRVGLGPR